MLYSTPVAYLLWFFSGFGALGLHRFYLGKPLSGIVYLLTGGIFMLGGIYDFFTLPGQVREANMRLEYHKALRRSYGRYRGPEFEQNLRDRFREEIRRDIKKDSPEKMILRTARRNNGVATPAEVALEGDISIDEAKEQLDALASKGYAEIKVTKAGLMVYLFPEFVTDPENLNLEDL